MKGLVFVISMFLLGGIGDGLESGASLTTVLWALPILAVMMFCALERK